MKSLKPWLKVWRKLFLKIICFVKLARFGAIILSLIRGTECSTLTAPHVSNQWQTAKNPITSSRTRNRDLYQPGTQRTRLPLVIPTAHCSEENIFFSTPTAPEPAHICGLRSEKHNVILAHSSKVHEHLIISQHELAFWSLESARISHPSTLAHNWHTTRCGSW